MPVVFIDNRLAVKDAMNSKIEAVLEECAGEVESQTKSNTAVDTGDTQNSWQHKVYPTESGFEAAVGSNYENAIWEEFGTGEYALEGKGRKGGWFYVDEKGKGHFTRGKKPRRALFRAFTSKKGWIIEHIQAALRGL